MAINFPESPSIGDKFTAGVKIYSWNGTSWVVDYSAILSGNTAQRPSTVDPTLFYNTQLDTYEVYQPHASRWEAVYTYPIIPTTIDPTVEYSEASFTDPGTYTWTCPPGVAYVHVVCVGGGGGAVVPSSSTYAYYNGGGAGGGLGWKNNIPVTPGANYTVQVGAGGDTIVSATTGYTGNSNPGTDSYFIDTSTVAGFGATANTIAGWKFGGGYVGDGGGNGGNSAPSMGYTVGAGGAGGYSGPGGDGGYSNGSVVIASLAGVGGAGGGGGLGGGGTGDYSGAGGGVGIYGEGASGGRGGDNTGTTGYPGGGGSGATTNILGNLTGGVFGGGAGTAAYSVLPQHGGRGAVRIIWGAGRAFPSSNTGIV